MITEKSIKSKLHRMGYFLRKSRIKDIHSNNLGGYMIVSKDGNYVVAGNDYNLDLDEVVEWTSYLAE